MKKKVVVPESVISVLQRDLAGELFPPERRLIPNLNDLSELELAFYEHLLLTDEELVRNAAYFR